MFQKLFTIINNKNGLPKYQKVLTWLKGGKNEEFDNECARARKYMEEKAARGEECKIVFLYVETGKTVVEQRLSDAIYHPILNITEKDSDRKSVV